MMHAIAAGAAWMSFLPFYHVDFPVELVPKEITYIAYEQGHEARQKLLSEREVIALKEFFVKNSKGWKGDMASYAPNHLFTSATMKINCFADGGVVVNYADKDNAWNQISIKKSIGACPKNILDEANSSTDMKPR